LQSEKKHLLESIEHVRERKSLLEEQMQEMIDLVQSAKEEMVTTSKVREENQEFFNELNHIHETIQNARGQLQQTEAARESILNERDQLREEIKALKQTYNSLLEEDWQRDVLAKLKQMQQEQILQGGTHKDIELVVCSKQEFEGHQKRKSALQRQIEELEQEKSEQMMKRRSLELDMEDLKSEKNTATKLAAAQVAEHQQTGAKLKKTISGLREDIHHKQAELELKQQKLLDAEQQCTIWKERANQTSEEAREKARKCIAAQTISTRLQKEVNSLKKKLQQQHRLASSFPKQILHHLPSHTLQTQLDLKDMKIQQLQQQCDSLLSIQHNMLDGDNSNLKGILQLFQREYQRLHSEYAQSLFSHDHDLESIRHAYAEKEENLKMQLQVLHRQIQNKEKQSAIRINAMENQIGYLCSKRDDSREKTSWNESQQYADEENMEKYLDEMKSLTEHYFDQSGYINELMNTIQSKDNQIIELISRMKQIKNDFDNKRAQQQEFVISLDKAMLFCSRPQVERVDTAVQVSSTRQLLSNQSSQTEHVSHRHQASQQTLDCCEKGVQSLQTSPLSSSEPMFNRHTQYHAILHADDQSESSVHGDESSEESRSSSGEESSTSSYNSSVSYLKDTIQALTGVLKEKNEYIRDLEREYCKVQNSLESLRHKRNASVQCEILSGNMGKDALRHVSFRSLLRVMKREVESSDTLQQKYKSRLLKLLDKFWLSVRSSANRVSESKAHVGTEGQPTQNTRAEGIVRRCVELLAAPETNDTFTIPKLRDPELQSKVHRFLETSKVGHDEADNGSNSTTDDSSNDWHLLQSLKQDIELMNENLGKTHLSLARRLNSNSARKK